MFIRNLKILKMAVILTLCLVLATGCKNEPVNEQKEQTPIETEEKSLNYQETADTLTEVPEETEAASLKTTETPDSVPDTSENVTENADDNDSNVFKKVVGASDDGGIYGIVVTLSDKAADKGVIEMIYYGAKGTPQENSIVNTFRIEYYKEEAGTYEIHTFYDGEVNLNYHHQTEVKVNNTFGADTRAGNVTIYYTPDGGETMEVYKADAEDFYVS